MILLGCQVETTPNIEKNLNKVLDIIKNEIFNICIFPELHLTSYDFDYIKSLKDEVIEKALNKIKNNLKENQLVIIGTAWRKYNSAAIIDKNNFSFYHKNSLTDDDKIFFQPGNKLKIINFLGYKIGFLICRDQNNINLINSYKQNNIDILIQLSAHFYKPETAIKKLDKNIAMPIVRAIDSNALLVKVNNVGSLNGKISLGNSMIVNKKGLVLRQANSYNEEIIKFNMEE